MSNLIKAYSIKYNEYDKRMIDTNEVAEEKIRNYIKLLKEKDGSQMETNSEDGFVLGLLADTVEEVAVSGHELHDNQASLRLEEQGCKKRSEEEAMEKASKIVEEAKEEVKRMLDNAQAEANILSNKIQEEAYDQGYQTGYQASLDEFERKQQELRKKEVELEAKYNQKVKDLEPMFVDLLLSFLKRFTGVMIEDKKDIILYLLEQELQQIENSKIYLIHVSKEDYDMVLSKKQELAWKLNEEAQIEIIEDSILNRGQCLIETDSRVIDCSLDVQLKNLTNDLRLLAGPRQT